MARIKIPQLGPETIALYYTVPTDSLSDADLKRIRTDFALAAHDQYQPMLRLHISTRTDFVGRTPEQVLAVLEHEKREDPETHNMHASFLLVTDETVLSAHAPGQEIEVVYVQRWASLEDFGEQGEQLEPSARVPRDKDSSELKFALKMRIVLFYAPVLWANLDIGNTSLLEELDQWPFDPAQQLPPPRKQTIDWRHEAPYPAAVVASPTSYEASDTEGDFMMLGSGERPKTYRLTQAAADALGLRPEWYPGWHDEREPEGHMTFSQPWLERELVLPDA
ncbi:hypothetical protein EXIGLDRAFT_828508 [Exidia glandulosa HHB12029]|uniref:Uncharacterized protein n=1 Tax=Exidia glandulosa HHB12029 TaxID=1314781 RepID=A0A165QID7_EXIGL|nr:hypothetical protein EXIGLDRAFT_828508 [Exidia glandulosa HHB12029]